MLAYFPEFRSDELLYSALARYRRHLGMPPASRTMVDLFDRRAVVAAFDLFGHLDALADRLPRRWGLSAETLAERHTLLPYYTAFADDSVHSEALRRMATEPVGVHLLLGVAASTVPRPSALRFCSLCRDDLIQQFGEAHWLRSHQLPGVLVCAIHARPLQQSQVTLLGTGRHELITANFDTCPNDAPALIGRISDAAMTKLHQLAKSSAGLLTRSFSTSVRICYREQLSRTGLMRGSSTVDRRQLREALVNYWGDALSLIGCDSELRWLDDLTRARRNNSHPLHHLLLSAVIDGRPVIEHPAGFGPWECRNVLAAHYGERVVEQFRSYRNHDAVVCIFECSCGHSYTRSLRNGVVGPARVRFVGPLLAPALRQQVQPGAALRVVARNVGLDPKSVIREALSMGLLVPWRCAPSGAPRTSPRNPSQAQLRQARIQIARKRRYDWTSLDSEMTVLVQNEAKSILMEDPPVRVTATEIERRMGRKQWLRQRRDRLPMANVAMDNLAETTESFQRRRVYATLAALSPWDELPKAWKVMRVTGLTCSHLPMIESLIAVIADRAAR